MEVPRLWGKMATQLANVEEEWMMKCFLDMEGGGNLSIKYKRQFLVMSHSKKHLVVVA